MAEPALEVSTAPRNLDELLKVQPFKLRLLATSLGVFKTPEQTAAWHQLQGKPQQAEYILSLLKDWDKTHANGANGTSSHSPVSVPAVAPGTVAAVRPEATAAAAAAAQPEQARSKGLKRNPVVPGDAGAPTSQPDVNLGAAVLEALASLQKTVDMTAQSVIDLKATNEARSVKLSETLHVLSQELEKVTATQAWTLTTLLTFAENQMSASPLDLLRSAITDTEALKALIQQVREELGKA